MKDGFILPDGSVTTDEGYAAEQWANAFYKMKDALSRIRPVPEKMIWGKSIRDLDEILAECDKALELGDNL